MEVTTGAKIVALLLAGVGIVGVGGVLFILAAEAWSEWTYRRNKKRRK